MGAGKSTVGAWLAAAEGLRFVDLDGEIEQRQGRTIAEIFQSEGEQAFRDIEQQVLAEVLSTNEPMVVSCGGGVVVRETNLEVLGERAWVCWLRADTGTLTKRVLQSGERPLVGADPLADIMAISATREHLYAQVADEVVDVDGLEPEQVGEAILKMWPAVGGSGMSHTSSDAGSYTSSDVSSEAMRSNAASSTPICVPVELAERSYEVWVGPGVRHRLAEVIPSGVGRAAVVTQAAVADAGITVDPGVEHRVFITDNGEQIKTLASVEQLCSEFAKWGLTRRDVVVAVGGGAVTDLAGFAAAVYHRGLQMVYVSTTLLGQIDASVGGKTGVNLPEGKNLVGAFWQPAAVLCDTEALDSLAAAETRSGLGEMAKYHFIGGALAVGLENLALPERIARCVQIKAEVVGADEREAGRRVVLNYGHTLAHALETHTSGENASTLSARGASGGEHLRHGEAVAIGLIYAAEVAHRAGRIDAARVQEHRDVVSSYGLPTTLPAGVDAEALLGLFSKDKKATHGVTLVLDGPNGVEPVTGLAPELLRESLEVIR